MREFTTRKYQRRQNSSLAMACRESHARPCSGQRQAPVSRAGTHRGPTKQNERRGAPSAPHTLSIVHPETELAEWDGQGHRAMLSLLPAHTHSPQAGRTRERFASHLWGAGGDGRRMQKQGSLCEGSSWGSRGWVHLIYPAPRVNKGMTTTYSSRSLTLSIKLGKNA